MDCSPVILRPFGERGRLGRIGVDRGDHHRPSRIARVPRGLAFADPLDGAIDGIKVHERQFAR